MSIIREKDLVIPALIAIEANGGEIEMTRLIETLRTILRPQGKDLAMLDNRNDDHFSQKVRNLVSHRTLDKLGLAKYSNRRLRITGHGEFFLRQFSDPPEEYDHRLEEEHLMVEEGEIVLSASERRSRNRAVRSKAIKIHGVACHACGMTFGETYQGLGAECIEFHHLVPMSEGRRTTRIAQLVPLCPNCHRVAHTVKPPLPVHRIKSMLRRTS